MPHPTINKKRRKDIIIPTKVEDNIFRHPRPLGLTMMNLNLNQRDRTKLNERIITLWMNEGMIWLGKQQTIPEFANYLNIKPEYLLRYINREMERMMNFMDSGEGRQLTRVHKNLALKKSLEILAQHQNQVHLLISQQGNEYVPFLTGETNKALANLSGALKPYIDAIKLLDEGIPKSIDPSKDGSSGTGATKYISASEAIQLLSQESDSMYTNKSLVAAKEQTMLGLPDVCARNQDLSTIGVKKQSNIPENIPLEKQPKRHNLHHERGAEDAPNPDDFIA